MYGSTDIAIIADDDLALGRIGVLDLDEPEVLRRRLAVRDRGEVPLTGGSGHGRTSGADGDR